MTARHGFLRSCPLRLSVLCRISYTVRLALTHFLKTDTPANVIKGTIGIPLTEEEENAEVALSKNIK